MCFERGFNGDLTLSEETFSEIVAPPWNYEMGRKSRSQKFHGQESDEEPKEKESATANQSHDVMVLADHEIMTLS